MSPEQVQALVARALEENPSARVVTLTDETEADACGALVMAGDYLSGTLLSDMTADEAEEQAKTYRAAAAHSLKGAFLCEQRAAELRAQEST